MTQQKNLYDLFDIPANLRPEADKAGVHWVPTPDSRALEGQLDGLREKVLSAAATPSDILLTINFAIDEYNDEHPGLTNIFNRTFITGERRKALNILKDMAKDPSASNALYHEFHDISCKMDQWKGCSGQYSHNILSEAMNELRAACNAQLEERADARDVLAGRKERLANSIPAARSGP